MKDPNATQNEQINGITYDQAVASDQISQARRSQYGRSQSEAVVQNAQAEYDKIYAAWDAMTDEEKAASEQGWDGSTEYDLVDGVLRSVTPPSGDTNIPPQTD